MTETTKVRRLRIQRLDAATKGDWVIDDIIDAEGKKREAYRCRGCGATVVEDGDARCGCLDEEHDEYDF